MKVKSLLFICLLLQFSFANSKMDDIKKLVETTGALKLGKQFSSVFGQQFANILKSSNPNLPDSFYDDMYKALDEVISEAMEAEGGLAQEIYKIYDKYYTHKDIKELIKFYQTDVGKKTIDIMPQLMQESMMAGQQWGLSATPQIMEKMKKYFKSKGVDFPAI